jgi:hypothetical protein
MPDTGAYVASDGLAFLLSSRVLRGRPSGTPALCLERTQQQVTQVRWHMHCPLTGARHRAEFSPTSFRQGEMNHVEPAEGHFCHCGGAAQRRSRICSDHGRSCWHAHALADASALERHGLGEQSGQHQPFARRHTASVTGHHDGQPGLCVSLREHRRGHRAERNAGEPHGQHRLVHGHKWLLDGDQRLIHEPEHQHA